ncbi:MAG TPA: hypothetical protein VF179_22480 [Thermoanaerobaculia bacterium]|nr:hypothetical protein [Thermoanaerobaculia bacterium]
MPRITLLILTLGLLAPHTPAGGVLRSVADLLSSDSGWERGPDGPTSSEPDPDRGWEIDPNG